MKSKVVVGFENYEIFEDGRLWSKNYNRFLVAFPIGRGNRYLAYKLCKEGKEKTFQVHRLVAIHFIPNPRNVSSVNHIDGNPHNNKVENLEWVTHQENMIHAFKTGLSSGENWQGDKHSRSTYTNEDVELICKQFEKGVVPKDLASSTSKEYQKLFRIWNRDNWKSISNKYVW